MTTINTAITAARLRLENAQLAYDEAAKKYKANGCKNTPEAIAEFKQLDDELSEAMRAFAKVVRA